MILKLLDSYSGFCPKCSMYKLNDAPLLDEATAIRNVDFAHKDIEDLQNMPVYEDELEYSDPQDDESLYKEYNNLINTFTSMVDGETEEGTHTFDINLKDEVSITDYLYRLHGILMKVNYFKEGHISNPILIEFIIQIRNTFYTTNPSIIELCCHVIYLISYFSVTPITARLIPIVIESLNYPSKEDTNSSSSTKIKMLSLQTLENVLSDSNIGYFSEFFDSKGFDYVELIISQEGKPSELYESCFSFLYALIYKHFGDMENEPIFLLPEDILMRISQILINAFALIMEVPDIDVISSFNTGLVSIINVLFFREGFINIAITNGVENLIDFIIKLLIDKNKDNLDAEGCLNYDKVLENITGMIFQLITLCPDSSLCSIEFYRQLLHFIEYPFMMEKIYKIFIAIGQQHPEIYNDERLFLEAHDKCYSMQYTYSFTVSVFILEYVRNANILQKRTLLTQELFDYLFYRFTQTVCVETFFDILIEIYQNDVEYWKRVFQEYEIFNKIQELFDNDDKVNVESIHIMLNLLNTE